ncbi:MAG: hypothetical protein J6031_05490 [Bacteroidales bacterium]|nr:hypothetical protein [Bacteroidales bacterium]
MRKNLLIIILLVTTIPLMGQEVSDDSHERQYTSWSILAGPNLSGCRFSLDATDNAPDRIAAAVGFDAGAAIGYHIASCWQLRLAVLANLERNRLYKDDEKTMLNSFGGDLLLQAGYTIPLGGVQMQLLCGPYTHFIIASNSSNHIIANPFSRTTAINPRTENPLFALGDLAAGVAFTLAFQPAKHWQIALDTRWGITDMLNIESHQLYVKPYKVALLSGWSF